MASHYNIIILKETSTVKNHKLDNFTPSGNKAMKSDSISKQYHLYVALQVKIKLFPYCLKKQSF